MKMNETMNVMVENAEINVEDAVKEYVEKGVKKFVDGMKEHVMNVGVLMLRKENVNGKEMKMIKMLDLKVDVKDFAFLGSEGKVKELMLKKVWESGYFGHCNEKDLWWRMDELIEAWKGVRSEIIKKRIKLRNEWFKNHPEFKSVESNEELVA